ncbi:MAG: asparagine synthase (glutamine-hydrolyzing) [Candidatus Acidiferrales bacterium]
MCGICGKLVFDRQSQVSRTVLKGMADSIYHRGPDDEGFYFSGQVGLGFRRLSIIDLGGGHQPLCNEDESVWIVFNGEIYNYQELRQFLLSKGHQFRTQSDTEVIVHLYEELGEACLERLRGMFAFAIWDNRRKSLFIARDRVGIKPLYYYHSNSSFIFGSEIKVILADPEVTPEVNPEMIDRILTFNYLPGEETLLKNIRKLAPGSCVLIQDGDVKIRQYWDLQVPQSSLSLAAAEEQLSAMLDESVRLHMISDVPVGFLLSGGVDSSAMLCMARGKTDGPLLSFTVGFSEPGITDERPYARLAAKAYGADHHEMTISSKDFENFLPQYIWHMEEPVCEPPAVAMYYVSQLARKFVKVLISGEGGDEGFGGYQIYRNLLWLERLKSVLKPMNGIVSKGLLRLNPYLKSSQIERFAPLLNIPFDSYYHSGTSNAANFFNQNMGTLYSQEFAPFVNRERSVNLVKKLLQKSAGRDLVNRMLYVDTKTWLVDDLLLKADKMTMANSLELRVPFLDHKILEFAASLPGKYKVHGFTTKYILKRVLSNRVPQEILNRKKVGFPVPYNAWLRTDLKDWIRDLLLDRETLQRGYFNRNCIERLISQNTALGGSYSKELFSLAVLELWHREFLGKQETPTRQSAFDPAPVL